MKDFDDAATRARMTAWGPFFEVTDLSAGIPTAASAGQAGRPADASETGWRPLARDLTSTTIMGGWVERARRRSAAAHDVPPAAVDARALASVLHLGVCARVLSPWVGWAVTGADVAVPHLEEVRWQANDTTMFPLGAAIRSEQSFGQDTQHTARDLVARLVAPLVSTRLTTSPAIAVGNAASALHGAARTISRHDPELAGPAREFTTACLTYLAATRPDAAPLYDGAITTSSFRRRSCCQLYRLRGNSRETVCGDCVLRERTSRSGG